MNLITAYGITVPREELEIYKKERNCGCAIETDSLSYYKFCPHCGNKMWSTKRTGTLFNESNMKWGKFDVYPAHEEKMYFVGIILGTFDTKGSYCYVSKHPGKDEISLLQGIKKDLAERYPNKTPYLYTFAG